MSKVIQHRAPSATVALVGVSAILAAGQETWPKQEAWPEKETPAYVTTHSERTFSTSEKELTDHEPTEAQDFGRKIAAVYAALSEGQEPLGAEFEAVWDANVTQLYES